MLTVAELAWFSLASLLLVLTPGPNMVYCVRALCQGRNAGMVSLPIDPPARLFRMGFLTNVLNPKVAMFYLSFFPQFLHPERGSVLWQSAALGAIQISVSGLVNLMLILGAASITAVLSHSEGWLRAQRYVMGSVLALLALRIAVDTRKAGT